MQRHSIKLKIMALFFGIAAGLVLIIVFINSTFSEKYYLSQKQQAMLDTYDGIDEIIHSYFNREIDETAMKDNIDSHTSTLGISVIIVNSDWTAIYNSDNAEGELLKRLQMSLFNPEMFGSSVPEAPSSAQDESESVTEGESKPSGIIKGNKDKQNLNDRFQTNGATEGIEREIIVQTDSYTMQKVYDSRLSDYYLELWGNMSDNAMIMMRLPLQSIKDSVNVTNTFITYIGLGVILLSVLLAYIFSAYITKPIKELSQIAERMSELDFNIRYNGKDKSELGILGRSINHMSSKLEENISHLKSANIELKKDIEKKIQIDEMRKDFLSNVSHELKTPIALIQGYAEGLKEGVIDDPESMNFYCDVIMDEANKMNNMVKKLLTLNQIEFGNEDIVMERFNITELINNVVNSNELRAEQKGATIQFDCKEAVYVWSDEYKIEEVITNYISNAINHCENELKIIVTMEKKDDCIRVSVFNTGKTIPEEDIDNIWIKFYKVDKARTREYGGNGIGLSIVKAIMDSYDRECGVINHSNGVEFWFEVDCKND